MLQIIESLIIQKGKLQQELSYYKSKEDQKETTTRLALSQSIADLTATIDRLTIIYDFAY